MSAATAPTRHLCVVLHDVAPARWEGCQRVLQRLRAIAHRAGVSLPVTLLTVPRLHGDRQVPLRYLAWLHHQVGRGHELALHGFTHRDDGPPPEGWRERLLRRHYTAGEGEFAALPLPAAAGRLAAAREWAQTMGLPMPGFVAPAWLLNAAARQAVAAAGFHYTCTLTRLVALPEWHAMPAPALVFSTRAPWRRAASLAWNTHLAWRARGAPLLRLELHPGDCDHAAVRRCWSHLLQAALEEGRVPLGLSQAAALARAGPAKRA